MRCGAARAACSPGWQPTDAGEPVPPSYSTEPDTATGFRNGPEIATFTRNLANAVAGLIDSGDSR
jgi:hypothetical protein